MLVRTKFFPQLGKNIMHYIFGSLCIINKEQGTIIHIRIVLAEHILKCFLFLIAFHVIILRQCLFLTMPPLEHIS